MFPQEVLHGFSVVDIFFPFNQKRNRFPLLSSDTTSLRGLLEDTLRMKEVNQIDWLTLFPL